MPWFNLRAMTDADLKAVYAFVRSLGAAGRSRRRPTSRRAARSTTPYFVFVPQVDQKQARLAEAGRVSAGSRPARRAAGRGTGSVRGPSSRCAAPGSAPRAGAAAGSAGPRGSR